jgi:5'-3' exonuclease
VAEVQERSSAAPSGPGAVVYLVDGTYDLFRCYFGAPSARTSAGREVGASRAIARSLLGLIHYQQATHVGVAFDHVIESFRNELFPGYKTSAGVPRDLLDQFETAERVTTALGIVAWPMVELEADDALCTAAHRLSSDPRVAQVRIVSPDKDLAQCVRGARVVRFDRKRAAVEDEDAIVARYGIRPGSIPDWLALVGDTADGIPGLEGWGPRSSSAALAAYGRIEDIPDDPAAWSFAVRGAAALAARLAARRSDAALYKRLATLVTDAPLACGLDDLAWCGADREATARIAAELEDPELVERVPRWRDESTAGCGAPPGRLP